jgi:hypothetical protein
MKRRSLTIAAIAAMSCFAGPSLAYSLKTTGRTLATPQLTADILKRITQYTRATNHCSFPFSADMQVLPRNYVPVQPAMPAVARGGHFERWTVNACGTKQRYQIGMWPSPRGGADFAVTPLTGRMPLHVR